MIGSQLNTLAYVRVSTEEGFRGQEITGDKGIKVAVFAIFDCRFCRFSLPFCSFSVRHFFGQKR